MTKVFSIVLLLAFLMPQFVKVGIFLSFKANQDYIAKVLCVNKDKPEMHCNGKCYLAKELSKTEKKSEKLPISVKNSTEIILFLENQTPFDFTKQFKAFKKELFFYLKKDECASFVDGVFHPPKQVLI